MSLNLPQTRALLYTRHSRFDLGTTVVLASDYTQVYQIKSSDHYFLAAGSDTYAFNLKNIYRGTGAAGDQHRLLTTVTSITAGVAIVGVNKDWTDKTITAAEVMRPHPTDFNQLINDAMDATSITFRKETIPTTVTCYIPLAHGYELANADWDGQRSATTFWDATSATVAKQTTDAEVFRGARSINVTGTAGQYIQAASLLNVGTSSQVMMRSLGKADSGTGTVRAVDASGTTIDSVTFTQENWLLIEKLLNIGSTTEQIRGRVLLTGSDELDMQYPVWFVKQDEPYFRLPSWLDYRFTVSGIVEAVPQQRGTETDTWLADSIKWRRLRAGPNGDYTYGNFGADAVPLNVTIENKSLLSKPLFIAVECPWSAPYGIASTLSTESATTEMPQDLLLAVSSFLLSQRYPEMAEIAELEFNNVRAIMTRAKPYEEPRKARPIGLLR